MVAAEFRLSNSLPLSTNKVRHFQQTRCATFSKQGAPLSANKARHFQQTRRATFSKQGAPHSANSMR
jgi:hypothetical protein